MKIYIAEDDQDIQVILKFTMSNLGKHDFQIFENGELLLSALEKEKPDLVILDVMMPVMDGIQAFHAIRKENDHKKLPVIFLSAKNDMDTIAEELKDDFTKFIKKPFIPNDLLKVIADF